MAHFESAREQKKAKKKEKQNQQLCRSYWYMYIACVWSTRIREHVEKWNFINPKGFKSKNRKKKREKKKEEKQEGTQSEFSGHHILYGKWAKYYAGAWVQCNVCKQAPERLIMPFEWNANFICHRYTLFNVPNRMIWRLIFTFFFSRFCSKNAPVFLL